MITCTCKVINRYETDRSSSFLLFRDHIVCVCVCVHCVQCFTFVKREREILISNHVRRSLTYSLVGKVFQAAGQVVLQVNQADLLKDLSKEVFLDMR